MEAALAAAWRARIGATEESAGAPTGSCAWAEGNQAVVNLVGAEENWAGRRRGLWVGDGRHVPGHGRSMAVVGGQHLGRRRT
jgi:hypothetical protein